MHHSESLEASECIGEIPVWESAAASFHPLPKVLAFCNRHYALSYRVAHDVRRCDESHMILLTIRPHISQIVARDRAVLEARV